MVGYVWFYSVYSSQFIEPSEASYRVKLTSKSKLSYRNFLVKKYENTSRDQRSRSVETKISPLLVFVVELVLLRCFDDRCGTTNGSCGCCVILVFTALRRMQTRCSNENSVCPPVCLSNACIMTKLKKDLSRFLYHMKDHLA